MEPREVQGRTAPLFPPGDPSPVLFDTTQLALERTICRRLPAPQCAGGQHRERNTPGYRRVDVDFHGALAAALGLRRQDAGRRTRPSRRRPISRRRHAGRRQLDRRRHRVGQALGQRPRVTRPPSRSPRPASRSSSPRWVSADEHLRRHRHLRVGAHRPAPADGRHGGEPRQRGDDQGRGRQPVPPQGGRPAAVAGRRLRRAARRRDGPHGRRARRRPGRGDHRGPDRTASSSTTRATRTPTRRATCACRTSTR